MKKYEEVIKGKKVLFTSHRTGFANTFNRPLIKLLKDAGAEVHYASNGEEKAQNCDKDFTLSITRNPFSVGNLKAYRQLKKIIEEEKYDFIHCHTPTGGVVTRLAARNARRHGTRVIYTAHGFHFFKGAPLINWLLFYPIEKLLARYTDTLLTINQEDYQRAKRNFRTNVQYIAGVGLDESKFEKVLSDKQKGELRKSLNLNPDDYVIIYPAEISVRKRQVWLINTLSTLLKHNASIHLLLPGMDSLDGQCQELAKSLKLTEKIHFLGLRSDIPSLLQISDLAVSASSQEGLPVNIMEALHVGLPVVATDCRGNADLLKGIEDCYIVSKDDGALFATHISDLHKKRVTSTALFHGKLKEDFYLSSILPRMKKIYSRLLLG